MAAITESNSQKSDGQNSTETMTMKEIPVKEKVVDPKEALQQAKEVVNKLNQQTGEEAYKIVGATDRIYDDRIVTMILNVSYHGQHLTSLELCVAAGRNGTQRGINPTPENMETLIKAAVIQSETKLIDQELATQQIQQVIDKLNQQNGEKAYEIIGKRTKTYDDNAVSMIFNIKYYGRNLTSLEFCANAGKTGIQRGINPTPENVETVIRAAAIRFESGISQNGNLIKPKLEPGFQK